MAHICWTLLEQKIVSASRWAGETLPHTLSGLPSTGNELAVLGECSPALALSHHSPFLRGCSPGFALRPQYRHPPALGASI